MASRRGARYKLVGERWISSRFNEKLEAFKHTQQQELEHLKFQINASMDRATKLHQREFETLPNSWAKFTKAYHSVLAFVSPVQSYTDVNRMNQHELNEHLAHTAFSQSDKDLVRAECDPKRREHIYRDLMYRYRCSEVQSICVEHNVDLDANGIFMLPEMESKFKNLSMLVWDALSEHKMNYQHELIPRERNKYEALDKQGPGLINELKDAVRERLWSGVSA